MPIHHFNPAHYHVTIGSHAPVLYVADGDTILTTTIDANGANAQGQTVSPGPNPMTGPFYVEGAEPGDTLAVHLDRITPSRTYGWSRAAVATNVVDPDFVPELPAREKAEWRVHAELETATLVTPRTVLGEWTVPIKPMLGCFGVAPADGQAISTATSAEHGGNMDYNGFVEGVTVYFPVFVTGALFHLGDGHAAQGDGEMVGTGIEISMETQFTVRLLKGKKIGTVRGENDEFIFAVGNARPLDQATQLATTEMLKWLGQDFGLDMVSASILFGQYVKYELGNMFDPAYTMVCKLPKDVLAAMDERRTAKN
jgi:acetamidase/formamidase